MAIPDLIGIDPAVHVPCAQNVVPYGPTGGDEAFHHFRLPGAISASPGLGRATGARDLAWVESRIDFLLLV